MRFFLLFGLGAALSGCGAETETRLPTKIEQALNPQADDGTRRYHLPEASYRQLRAPGQPAPQDLEPPADPFAAIGEESSHQRLPLVAELFEIPDGASLEYRRAAEMLVVAGEPAFLDEIEATLAKLVSPEKQIRIQVEAIDVATVDFSNWLFENEMSGNGDPLREKVGEWLSTGAATHVETIGGIARSGQRATFEGVRLTQLPNHFDPAKVPESVTLDDASEAPVQPPHPSVWSEWKVGARMEVDPVIDRDQRTIFLNLAPEIVERVGTRIVPIDQSLTTLYFQAVTTQVMVADGHYTLLGSTHPHNLRNRCVLWFARADIISPPAYRRLTNSETR